MFMQCKSNLESVQSLSAQTVNAQLAIQDLRNLEQQRQNYDRSVKIINLYE